MARIERIHWGTVGSRLWREQPGSLFALWPEPIDYDACFKQAGFECFLDSDEAWDKDFDSILNRVLAALSTHGVVTVVGDPPLWHQALVDRLLRRPGPELSLPEQLALVATDDQFAPCHVEFGSPPCAAIFVADGHPIVWIWLHETVVPTWAKTLVAISSGRDVVETTLQWEHLLPTLSLPLEQP